MRKKYTAPAIQTHRLAGTPTVMAGSFNGNTETPQYLEILPGEIEHEDDIG